jgi:hypothetical protein
MFTVERVAEDRLDVTMSGRLDTDGMTRALDELVERSEGIVDGRMLYDVVEYHLPSLGAIVLEFSRMIPMLQLMRRFRRAAVLCDQQWIRTVSELEGLLMPHLAIRAFPRDQRVAAERWLAEGETPPG